MEEYIKQTDILVLPVVGTDRFMVIRKDKKKPLYVSYERVVEQLKSILGSGGSVLLQTNGTPNTVQNILNLVQGTGITITDNGDGSVTIDATGGGGGGGVQSVTGNLVDNTDPANPIVDAAVSADIGNDLILGSDGLPFFQQTSNPPLEVKSNSVVIDSNVNEMNFLPPLEAIQTAAGKVNVRLPSSALTGAPYELATRHVGQTTGMCAVDNGTVRRLFVAQSNANAVYVFDTDSFDIISTITLANAVEPRYIQSLDEVWVSRSGITGVVLRINPNTLAVTTSSDNLQNKTAYIEYLNPISGNPRIFIFSQNTAAAPAGSAFVVYDIVLETFTSVPVTAGQRFLDAVLVTNPASPMYRHIVAVSDQSAQGLSIIDCETNAIVNGVYPTGSSYTSTTRAYAIDYSESRDEFICTFGNDGTLNVGRWVIAVFEADSVSTFLELFKIGGAGAINGLPRCHRILYDEPNGVFICGQSGSGLASNQQSYTKFQIYDINTRQSIAAVNTQNTSNTVLSSGMEIIGNGEAVMCNRDATGNYNNVMVKIKYR